MHRFSPARNKRKSGTHPKARPELVQLPEYLLCADVAPMTTKSRSAGVKSPTNQTRRSEGNEGTVQVRGGKLHHTLPDVTKFSPVTKEPYVWTMAWLHTRRTQASTMPTTDSRNGLRLEAKKWCDEHGKDGRGESSAHLFVCVNEAMSRANW